MKQLVSILLAGWLTLSLAAPMDARAGEKLVCGVCKVKEGKSELETVEARRSHDGTVYGFCSEKCAKEFDLDPAAYLPPLFPRAAPELAIRDLSGNLLSWESLRGKVVLVDFWATWCAPCRRSMLELQALYDKYATRGFAAVGVSIDETKEIGKVKKFISSKKITYPIALDSKDSPAWERFHVKAVPAAFLVDRTGQVVAQWTGASAGAKELERRIASLLAPTD